MRFWVCWVMECEDIGYGLNEILERGKLRYLSRIQRHISEELDKLLNQDDGSVAEYGKMWKRNIYLTLNPIASRISM